MVTDGLSTYKPVVDRLGLDRQVCVTHVSKNPARRMRKVKVWQAWKSRLRSLLDELPDNCGKRLMYMEREVREDPSMRLLAIDYERNGVACYATSVCDNNNVMSE